MRAWGAAQTPTADTRYDAASGFGCATGQSAIITTADLLAHTDWTTGANRLLFRTQLTSLKEGDFAGLNLEYLGLRWTNIKELPARIFGGTTVALEEVSIEHAPQLERIHPEAFEGLQIADNRFVFRLYGLSKLTEETIPPTVFDPIGEQGFTNANANVQWLRLDGPQISHINTRWFASLTKTGTLAWEAIQLDGSGDNANNIGGRGIYDTYYYDDGDGRFTDGTETTPGENSILSTTTKATLGTAISAEMARYANRKPGVSVTVAAAAQLADATTIRNFGQGADNASPFQVSRTHWGSVDLCTRTPTIRDLILAELRTEQPTIYGTAADHTSGSYALTTNFDCTYLSATDSAIVTKTLLNTHTNWNTQATGMFLDRKNLTALRFHDFRYLDLDYLDFGLNSISEFPDDIFSGLDLKRLVLDGVGIRKMQSRLFRGITATGLHLVGLSDNPGLSDINIAPDAFDPLTDVRFLSLQRTGIGRINTRWFAHLTELGNGAGWYRLILTGSPVVKHFYNDGTGGYYGTGATEKAAYDPTVAADATALQQAISAKIAAYATATNGVTDNSQLANSGKFNAPDGLGIDPCDRNPAVWKELMRQFQYIRDDLAELTGAPWPIWNVASHDDFGDIRHERYANITQSQCAVLKAQWVNANTGAPIADQSAPNSATDKLAIKDDESFGHHSNSFRLDGSDLSTLQASDLANFHAVQRIWLNGTGLENVSPTLFADMPKLTHLTLADNKLDTADFATSNVLAPLDNLVQLNLNGNLLTRFDADWLTSAAQNSMRQLYIADNPVARTDMTGLNLSHLQIHATSIIELDPAISDMSHLQHFWWWGMRALPIDGYEDFVDGLPSRLTLSIPDNRFGNPSGLEDADLERASLAFSLAHRAKVSAINTAGGGDQLIYIQAADPCRPLVDAAGGLDAWSTDYGDLCLTSAQRDAFISSIDGLNAVGHFILTNTNLSDAQMATLLGKLADHDNVYGLQFDGNPEAFGAGFNDAALAAFLELDDLWMLRLRNHDLNYAQASTMLRNVETASASDAYTRQWRGATINTRPGVTVLDLAHNPMLFKTPDSTDPTMMVDVDPDDLHTFLRGILPHQEGTGYSVNLEGTGLNFDQLQTVLWSIENGPSPTNLSQIATLNVSHNPNLWKRPNQAGTYDDVTATEIEELLATLPGLRSIHVAKTGITTQAQLEAIFDGLNTAPSTDKAIDPRDTSALERLTAITLSGNDLSATTDLESVFAGFAIRNALQSPQLRTIGLANTSITLAQLTDIVDGLDTADLLDGVVNLDLSDNADLFDGCDANTSLESLLRRFTNLRQMDIRDSSLSFGEFKCAVNGLTPANAVHINARDNDGLFTGVANAMVGELLAPFRYTTTNLVNTGLTSGQASAIATQRAEGQSDDERRETERRTGAQNPLFTFKTPLPDEVDVQSGRGSLRVAFTHNPMYNNAAFTVLRYEYRYRVRPGSEQAASAWSNTGTEAWRTASLDLTEPGEKTFDIFGLATETVYQVQLRATSVARPAILTLTGGTSINLPEINSIKPAITEVNMRAGDQVRLEVNIYGLADILNNDLYGKSGSKLFFTWSDDPSGGSFADPRDARRVTYTAPSLPGTYTVMAEAGPDGICTDHHKTNFGISDADREDCQATITVRVSRAQTPAEPPADPINPAGPIPSSLTDSEGIAYTVFTPVDGGTFTSDDITITATAGAVPDRQLIGVSAAVSAHQAPAATPGARMTISGSLYDIAAIGADRQPVSGFTLDEPLTACLPLPTAFRANISDVVIVERKTDGSYGILSSKLRQTAGELTVCGKVSAVPATVGVAKLGVVPEPPTPPATDGPEPPETGPPAPSITTATLTLALGTLLLLVLATTMTTIRRRGGS